MSMPVAVQVSEVFDYKQIVELSDISLLEKDLSPVAGLTEAGPPL